MSVLLECEAAAGADSLDSSDGKVAGGLLSREQGRSIPQYWLHFVGKHIANFKIVDMPAGIVGRHTFIDGFSQGGGWIALGTHRGATGTELGGAARFKTGDHASAVTHDKRGGGRLILLAGMEVAILIWCGERGCKFGSEKPANL